MKYTDRIKPVECLICDRQFFILTGSKRKTAAKIRVRHSLTCSRKCSRKYKRIVNIVESRLRKRNNPPQLNSGEIHNES